MQRLSTTLEVAAMVGVDPDSDGRPRARRVLLPGVGTIGALVRAR